MNTPPSRQGWPFWRATAALFLVSAVITGCGSGIGSGGTGAINASTVAQSSVARDVNPQVSDADLAAVVAGNTDFALKAFPLLDPGGGANTVFSPYSITQALALTAAGARGTTLSGIEQALAFPLAQDRLNPAFNKLDLQLKAKTSGTVQDTVGQQPNLNIVNTVWGQQGHTFLASYLDTIALNFGSGLRLLDFAHAAEASRQTINGWVADQTKQRITDLVPQGAIDKTAALVLTNAIWFNGNWASPFYEANTQNKPFYGRDGSSSSVPFMRGIFAYSFLYAQGNGYKAVDIPYTGGNLSMLVIMPDAGTFDTFLAGLTPSRLGDIFSLLSYPHTSLGYFTGADGSVNNVQSSLDINLSLPKFTFSATPDIGSILGTLGMADAFDMSKADFIGIDGGDSYGKNDLYISNVIQKAFIIVDEKGTEATAATTITYPTGTLVNPQLPLVIDHPFIFLIRDRQTGLILFMGKVVTL